MHLGFFKSIEGSDNFALPSKSLLPPHGSSPASGTICTFTSERCWQASGRAPCCRAVPAPERCGSDHRPGPCICRAAGDFISQAIQNLSGVGRAKLSSCLLCFLREGEEGDAEPTQAQGHARPGNPPKPGGEDRSTERNGNFLKIHEKRGIERRMKRKPVVLG